MRGQETLAYFFGMICNYYNAFVYQFVTAVYYLFTRKVSSLKKDKSVVVITGCDSGFGNMLSVELAQQGYHVISACQSDEGIQSLKRSVAKTIKCDVTNQEQVNQLAAEVEKYITRSNRDLRLWAVVNNAGIAPLGNLDWLNLSCFEKAMDVDYIGAVRVIKAMLPLLKKTKFSRIVNVSSIFGLVGCPAYSPYAGKLSYRLMDA
jgi:NAD(P)-dependent dehydrogenase (short-subunit alcohol dehydrogenase family)